MTPLKQLFTKTQRIVRDISLKLNKEVHFEMSGEDTEIDRSLVEILSDPLMHMIRNSMDHGIEHAEVRRAKAKPERGHIKLMASQEGGRVLVRIQDDGGGIDREKIIAKAIKNNLLSASVDTSKMTDREVFEFLCLPGFSTAEKVTDLSGRGVGLDVVKSNIDRIRGTLEIESVLGVGTTFIISLPLTTSIIDGILLEINDSLYVLPISVVREILTLDISKITVLSHGDLVLSHRAESFPLIYLPSLLDSESKNKSVKNKSAILLIEVGPKIIGIVVGKVLGQTQVVLKSLGQTFHTGMGIAGGAIMGDGRVALVLDPIGLCGYFEKKKNNFKLSILDEAA
jgi:two-component system chemotaxis sensor kinase CheA